MKEGANGADGSYYNVTYSVEDEVSAQVCSQVRITFPFVSGFSYSTYVASGHKVRIGWVIFIALAGLVVIGLMLAVGCFGYFIKQRKRSLGYDTITSEE